MFYPNTIKSIYTPNVTWSLHHNIIADAGFEEKNFRYYSPVTKAFDIDGMLEDIEKIEDEQVLLL
jgi:aspartate/tyrosine/aromatic aminotransferase